MTIEDLVGISKLFIPVIAICAVYIARLQYVANREKVRLELYDKRFKIYDSITRYLSEVAFGSEESEKKEYGTFLTSCNEAQFLLPDRIYIIVEEIKKAVFEIRRLRRKEKRNNVEGDRQAIVDQIVNLEEELENVSQNLTTAFKEVLKFELI
jgi:hypothetical protein